MQEPLLPLILLMFLKKILRWIDYGRKGCFDSLFKSKGKTAFSVDVCPFSLGFIGEKAPKNVLKRGVFADVLPISELYRHLCAIYPDLSLLVCGGDGEKIAEHLNAPYIPDLVHLGLLRAFLNHHDYCVSSKI
jgi:hypothetical protein